MLKVDFSTKYEDILAFLKVGDSITIQYMDSEGMKTITDLK